jgi:hypothetical protein
MQNDKNPSKDKASKSFWLGFESFEKIIKRRFVYGGKCQKN